jgi:hypothetical protein
MKPSIARSISDLGGAFGSCPICMRKSLAAALVAWGICLAALLVWPDRILVIFLGLFAIGLTGLWTLHVTIFAARALMIARREKVQAVDRRTSDELMVVDATQFNRRAALRVLFKAAGAAAFTSISFWPISSLASAHSCADGTSCDSGFKCCWNSIGDAYFCCNSSHLCCTSGHSNYCRNPDANEYC